MYSYDQYVAKKPLPKVNLSKRINSLTEQDVTVDLNDDQGNTNSIARINKHGMQLLNGIRQTVFAKGEFKPVKEDVEPPMLQFVRIKPEKPLRWHFDLRGTEDGCVALAAVNSLTNEVLPDGWLVKFMKNRGMYLYHTVNPKLGFDLDAEGRLYIL